MTKPLHGGIDASGGHIGPEVEPVSTDAALRCSIYIIPVVGSIHVFRVFGHYVWTLFTCSKDREVGKVDIFL